MIVTASAAGAWFCAPTVFHAKARGARRNHRALTGVSAEGLETMIGIIGLLVIEPLTHDLPVLPATDRDLFDLHRPHPLQVDVVLPLGKGDVAVRGMGKHVRMKLLGHLLHLLACSHPRVAT